MKVRAMTDHEQREMARIYLYEEDSAESARETIELFQVLDALVRHDKVLIKLGLLKYSMELDRAEKLLAPRRLGRRLAEL